MTNGPRDLSPRAWLTPSRKSITGLGNASTRNSVISRFGFRARERLGMSTTQTPDDEWAQQALALLMERVKRAVRMEYARLARELL